MTVWPPPAPDPFEERGEDPETGLLPNLGRLRALSATQRLELLLLVVDWIGPQVEEFRARVRVL